MGDDVVWFLGEFLGVWTWGLFFCVGEGRKEGRTDSLPAAEFPCDVPGGGVASALRWMWVG